MPNHYLILAVGIIGLSVSAIFVKFTSAPSEIIAFYRLLFTFILTVPMIIKTKQKDWTNITKKDILLIFLSAACLSFYFTTWFSSLLYTTVTSSTVLVNIHPIFVIVFSFFLWKEPITKEKILSVCWALVGIVILNWGDFSLGLQHIWGNVLALLGALFLTGHLLCTTQVRSKMEIVPYTVILYACGTLIMGGYALISKAPFTGYTHQDFLMFFLLALCSTVLGQSLLSWCLKYLSTTLVSLATLGEPIIAAALAYIILHENISIAQGIGSILILASIAYYAKSQKPDQTPELGMDKQTK